MISNRFIDGRHSFWSPGSRWLSKSLPSARDGLLKRVLVIMRGGWNGNLSLSRMSKLNVSVVVARDKADFDISN